MLTKQTPLNAGTRAPCPHGWRYSRDKLPAFTDHGVPINIDMYDIISQEVQICNLNLLFYMVDFPVNCIECYYTRYFCKSAGIV